MCFFWGGEGVNLARGILRVLVLEMHINMDNNHVHLKLIYSNIFQGF